MKILIIRLSSLGDIVLTQPITAELRRLYPKAQIHYLTKAAFAGLVGTFGTIDRIIPYDLSLAFHLEQAHSGYDLVIDLHAKLASFLISLCCFRSKVLRYHKARSIRTRIVKKHLKQGIESTVVLYLSALNRLPDFRASEPLSKPVLIVPELDVDFPPIPPGKTITAIFPGATHKTKMIPSQKLAETVQSLSESHYFLILGSSSEHWLGEIILKGQADAGINLCGKYTIPELIKAISKTDLVISNDSGPMHLAAALGKKQIAFFGATHPALGFAPLNPDAALIVKNPDCQPCSLHGGEACPRGDFRCMNDISPSEIVQLIQKLS